MRATEPHKLWWTAAELAEAALPDIPGTKRRVNAMAEAGNWAADRTRARRRAGKGGGWEYHWTLLPMRAQTKLLTAAAPAPLAALSPGSDRDAQWQWFESLPAGPKEKARSRLGTIQKAEAFEAGGMTKFLAVETAAQIDAVSPRSVWSWMAQIEGIRSDDRLAYLAPRHRAAERRYRRSDIDPRFAALIRSDWLRPAAPSLTSVYDRAVRISKETDVPIPPIHTVRRWTNAFPRPMVIYARKGLEALKRLQPSQIRDRSTLRALEGVNGDYHRFDVFVRFPAGPGGEKEEIGRPMMVAFQDLLSAKFLAHRVDRTATSHAVQLCIGDMIERWGIPEHVLLDNGREFAAKLITGGSKTRFRFKVKDDDVPGLLTTLGSEIHWAQPYSGQSKPIERAFRDLCDRVAKHPAFDGAYTGNKPDAKPEDYGSRAIPLADFLAVLDEEIAQHNARPDRRSEIAYGRSFDDVFNESYARAPIRKATAEQRRMWLLGAEGLKADARTGQVNFMRNRYHADWMIEIAGQRVVARFDRGALWDGLHIYGMDDAYLGFAPCSVKSGFFDIDDARATQKARSAYFKATKAQLAAARELAPSDIAASLRALPKAEPETLVSKVVRMVTPARKAPPPQRPDEAAHHSAIIAEFDVARPKPKAPEDGRETYARALDLERRAAGGETLSKDQSMWLVSYQTTSDYRAWRTMVEDFGEDILAG